MSSQDPQQGANKRDMKPDTQQPKVPNSRDASAGARPPTTPGASKPPGKSADSAGDGAWEQPSTPVTQQIGRGVVVLLAVLFGIFAVANSQPVSFSWIFGETQVITDTQGTIVSGGVPLIVLLLASVAIGFLVGITVMWQRGRTRRRSTRTSDPGSK